MPEFAMPAFDHAAEAETLTSILAGLVAAPTDYPPGNTVDLAQNVAGGLRQIGYRVEIHERSAGLANVIASIGSGAPHLMFNAHMDTVGVGERTEWRTDPFVLTPVGDRLYGLGASNCKGSMAVHLWLARRIAELGGPARGTVSFTFVADEESLGSEGMAYLRQAGIARPDLLCLGAPTGNAAITAERGVMWAAVTTTGKATGDFNSKYVIKATSVTTGSSMAQTNGTHEMEMTGTWEGACPANMKPGDMTLPNGMTMNLNSLPGK